MSLQSRSFVIVAAVLALMHHTQAEENVETLIGVWRGGFGGLTGGELLIAGQKSKWEASIKPALSNQKISTAVEHDRDKVEFAWPKVNSADGQAATRSSAIGFSRLTR